MSAMGIIFSNHHNETLDELTRKRTTASIPFGGRYRLIDFALSNIVSADIINVGVIAHKNYQSLMDHIGSGKDWDLSRRNGGLIIFPPFGNYLSGYGSLNRLEGLKGISGYIAKGSDEHVILMDCDNVNVIDLQDVLNQHIENNADLTIVYKKGYVTDDLVNNMSIIVDGQDRVIHASLKSSEGVESCVSVNVWVINRRLLLSLIDESVAMGYNSFEKNIILGKLNALKIFGYEYNGIYMHISNMENYYKNNMELLKSDVREALFGQDNHRIYTKVRDSAPTRYGNNTKVQNSFIADGCEIEGTVINSILFRGVKIGKGTVVQNSILMQDTIIGNYVTLNCVITDKNVTIRDRNNLSGCPKIPYYLGKNIMV